MLAYIDVRTTLVVDTGEVLSFALECCEHKLLVIDYFLIRSLFSAVICYICNILRVE
jgi:hypothetical protein